MDEVFFFVWGEGDGAHSVNFRQWHS
jgi:hypothetical protein